MRLLKHYAKMTYNRAGSRAAAASKMEWFVIIVNSLQPLTIITKHSILDVAAALDPPLYKIVHENLKLEFWCIIEEMVSLVESIEIIK